MSDNAPRALTLEEAAASVGVAKVTLRRAIAAGALAAKKNGRRFLITPGALDDWFASLPDA